MVMTRLLMPDVKYCSLAELASTRTLPSSGNGMSGSRDYPKYSQ